MSAVLLSEPPPIMEAEGGTLRVGATRVTLDTVIGAFHDGASAEEIVDGYPVLTLADVYQVIGYYLRHRQELDQYLAVREEAAIRTRALIESRCPPDGLRARLLARQHR